MQLGRVLRAVERVVLEHHARLGQAAVQPKIRRLVHMTEDQLVRHSAVPGKEIEDRFGVRAFFGMDLHAHAKLCGCTGSGFQRHKGRLLQRGFARALDQARSYRIGQRARLLEPEAGLIQ